MAVSKLHMHSRLHRQPDVLFVDMNGETVILNDEAVEYLKLDAVAADIWQRLEQPRLVADLVSDLVQAYDGDAAAIEADVLTFLGGFVAKGLLRETP